MFNLETDTIMAVTCDIESVQREIQMLSIITADRESVLIYDYVHIYSFYLIFM